MELFLECQSRISINFRCIFSGEDHLWLFWQKGNIIFASPIHMYRKYHIFMYFLRKIIFHFPSKVKISIFWVKNIIFPDKRKKIRFYCDIFGKTIFSEHLMKISYFYVFFWDRWSFISYLKNKITFSGKRNDIFLDNTKKIIFECDFLEISFFHKIWK